MADTSALGAGASNGVEVRLLSSANKQRIMEKTIKLQKPMLNDEGFLVYRLNDSDCRTLITLGDTALNYTYPIPNKGFAVALLTDSGNTYTGASYVSDTHNTTMHSEAVALAMAAQHGEVRIVAITGPNCHNCKQLIWESSIRSKIDTLIIFEEEGSVMQIPISQMMPYPWPNKNGEK